jgi:diaminohydroxyphosphoribosylaminopyrimidine deaminase/5-amino-6-(5-phosphoribosylamino)uracil reductase
LRVVLDTRLKLTEWSKLAQTAAEIPTLVYTTAPIDMGGALEACGVTIMRLPKDAAGRPAIAAVVADLAARGITRLLVEGGAAVHASFLNAGLADRLEVVSAPMILGGAGLSSVEALAALALGEAPQFVMTGRRRLGQDLLVSYALKV